MKPAFFAEAAGRQRCGRAELIAPAPAREDPYETRCSSRSCRRQASSSPPGLPTVSRGAEATHAS